MQKTDKYGRGCPLCRCHIALKSIVELKFECVERSNGLLPLSVSNRTQKLKARLMQIQTATKQELEDVRQRLSKATSDLLEVQEQCALMENENTSFREAVLRMQEDNATLVGENKNLKVVAAADKTSIGQLHNLLQKAKARLKKLEDVHNYLKADDHGAQSFDSCLKTLSSTEKLALLSNRVIELEGVNKTLVDLKDVWKRKCDELSGEYLVLEREHRAAMMAKAPTNLEHLWDPFSESSSSTSSGREKNAEAEHDMLRSIPKSIDVSQIGSSRALEVETKSPHRRTHVEAFDSHTESASTKAPKLKTQRISDFFKAN
ncbi:caspase recruitment domain-containing protein 11, putative [Babesia ovata]|uniref:Caspase recruitment domain-containing protein 11, putative n=1 Tax=Babesia ovata TaxID=189622 RepID=A0A2H6KEQ3_9APIC|nr:caspase recruitment domain-containing protein 11, putative [Babesia ovata]GBE61478.1 caspase recruitment domain-containing protein 11, putative [Babesia ovata]